VIDGEVQTLYPEEGMGFEILSLVPAETERYGITIESSTLPITISIAFFTTAPGLDPGEPFLVLPCAQLSDSCPVETAKDEVEISFTVPSGADVAVVSLEYALEYDDLEAAEGVIVVDRSSYGWWIVEPGTEALP
jgi:hypothetical protein